GARVRLLKQRQRGDILRAEVSLTRGRPRGQLLILGHLDTVYEPGTLKRTPFRLRRGRAYGPGTLDMKSGLVQALFAVDALKAMNLHPAARLVFLFTSDEEIGSAAGRPVLEREARRSHAVLVVEPASGEHGALKTARKGVGEFTLEVTGRAAHAGIEPGQGVNAIEELAAQIVRLKKLERDGVTLNANVIEGGTRTNVIAAQARVRVDVRIARRADGPWIEKRIRSLRPVNRRAKLTVRGGINRPPLERTPEVVRLFQHAQMVARSFDMELEESSTGGGSDGSFTSALGVPTLDGLGGVGGGAHTAEEFVFVGKMPERACLLASLLLTL
ncbi:MAG: M20/M25/M40 family metallo-hydrolase, partial [Terriglobia bacterium]